MGRLDNLKSRNKVIILAILTILVLASMIMYKPNISVGAESKAFYYYTELTSDCPIVLSGAASFSNGDIYLTRNVNDSAGAAFSKTKMEENTGFSIYLKLSTSNRK